jgi:hypothetical protein
LTIRLAYVSLMKKLQARETTKDKKKTVTIVLPSETTLPVQKTIGVINAFNSSTDPKSCTRAMTLDSSIREVSFFNLWHCFFY